VTFIVEQIPGDAPSAPKTYTVATLDEARQLTQGFSPADEWFVQEPPATGKHTGVPVEHGVGPWTGHDAD